MSLILGEGLERRVIFPQLVLGTQDTYLRRDGWTELIWVAGKTPRLVIYVKVVIHFSCNRTRSNSFVDRRLAINESRRLRLAYSKSGFGAVSSALLVSHDDDPRRCELRYHRLVWHMDDGGRSGRPASGHVPVVAVYTESQGPRGRRRRHGSMNDSQTERGRPVMRQLVRLTAT